jgi:hypothetical protein
MLANQTKHELLLHWLNLECFICIIQNLNLGVPKLFVLFESLNFCELVAHAKFDNPTTIPSWVLSYGTEKDRRKKIITKNSGLPRLDQNNCTCTMIACIALSELLHVHSGSPISYTDASGNDGNAGPENNLTNGARAALSLKCKQS